MYLFVYIHIHIYMYIHTYEYTYTYIYIHIYYLCIHVYINIHILICHVAQAARQERQRMVTAGARHTSRPVKSSSAVLSYSLVVLSCRTVLNLESRPQSRVIHMTRPHYCLLSERELCAVCCVACGVVCVAVVADERRLGGRWTTYLSRKADYLAFRKLQSHCGHCR